jgi:16S rRNA (uracil1498-N3)-methyltransferase
MTRRRWIADEVSGNKAFLTGEHADHLIRVLRAQVGQEFDIATGTAVHRARIANIEPRRVEFDLGEEISSATSTKITLLLSVFKFDRMEWAIEKCTELGVSCIVPLIAKRTDAHLAAAAVKRSERWRKIAREAAEQSRRSDVPEVMAPRKLKDAMNSSAALRIVLDEAEQEKLLLDAIAPETSDLALAIGTEGGWTEDELDQLHSAGWISASLGSTILRVETAAIAAMSIATAALTKGSI